jgi:hypothetical protein
VRPPQRLVWFRAADPLPEDPALHCYLLAYASDFHFMTTAMQPHGVSWLSPGMHVASLDHAMWFHAPLRLDEWLLYAIDSPAASGGPRPRPRLVLQPRWPAGGVDRPGGADAPLADRTGAMIRGRRSGRP